MTAPISLVPADDPSACAPRHEALEAPVCLSYWEQAGGLRDHWYIACTSAQLRHGRVRAVTLFGRGLALFRQADGRAAAIIDQCVHRGVRLSAGKVKKGCVACPYHGWRYDGSGQVVHIPSVDGLHAPGKVHPFRQRSFPVCEQDGAVWVYLGDGEAPPPPVYRMPFFERDDFASYYMTGEYAGDLGAIAQINMDVSHTVFVHGNLFRTTAGKRLESTIEVMPRAVEVVYRGRREGLGPIPWLTNPRGEQLQHTDRYFAPNITQVDYHWGDTSGLVFVSVISPIDEHRALLYTCISYKFPLPPRVLGWLRPLMNAYTKGVNRQDIQLMREQQAGLANAPVARRHSVRADMAHVAIEKILAAVRERRTVPESILGVRRMDYEI